MTLFHSSDHYRTKLSVAIRANNPQDVKKYLSKVNVDQTMLMKITFLNKVFREYPPNSAGTGIPPIVYAAEHGYEEIVKLLILAGVQVNATDYRGYTALYAAAKEGHLNIVKHLVNANASIDKDIYDKSPQVVLVDEKGNQSLVPLLNQPSNALIAATLKSHQKIVEYLKARVNYIEKIDTAYGLENLDELAKQWGQPHKMAPRL